MKIVTEVLSAVGNGITEPYYALIDGVLCVIKFINNPEGATALINEYVGYSIANSAGLRLPEYGFATTTSETSFEETEMQQEYTSCICFYTVFIEKTVLFRSAKQIVECESHDLLNILLIDCILCNTDRNPGNLLLKKSKKAPLIIYPIDYTHAFHLGVLWPYDNALAKIESGIIQLNVADYLSQQIPCLFKESRRFTREELTGCGRIMMNQLLGLNIEEMLNSIPNNLFDEVPEINKDSFVNFLNQRVLGINNITNDICEQFGIAKEVSLN